MLVGFSVSNYKSFMDSQSISFVASKITRHKAHLVEVNNRKILKGGLIFGANAGGKTNLIKAVKISRDIVIKGLDRVNLSKAYYRIDGAFYERPGVFEYRLVTSTGEYSYGFAVRYDNQEIVSEWLFRINPSGSEYCIFNRCVNDAGNSIVETDLDLKASKDSARLDVYFEDFGKDISDAFKKKTILSDIAMRSNGKSGIFAEILQVYEWFEKIIIIFPNSKYSLLNEIGTDDARKSLFQNLMSYFDTGIETVENQSQTFDFDKIFENMSRERADKLKADLYNKTSNHMVTMRINNQVVVLHKDDAGSVVYNKLLLNHGNPNDKFEYLDESDGTKRLFDLVPLMFEAVKDRVVLIDEIDRSLHTRLTRRFIELFFEKNVGVKCQLIATTHDSNLLDLDLVRQDEIWFVERGEDHSSRVFSLNKFKARFDKKIDKDYLLGRYGAIPLFDEDLLEANDEK